MRWPVLLAVLALGSSAAAAPTLDLERRRLAAAKAAAASAEARAAELQRAADGERNAQRKVERQRDAVVERISAGQAELEAAQARVAVVAALVDRQRAELAAKQRPIGRLIAALQSFARRPAIVAVAQPGTVSDLVHIRAVLGSTLPVIRARTATLRDELAESRRLRQDASLAAAALAQARARLEREREALATLEARHGARALALGRDALDQSDRAIAMGEAARDIVDRMAGAGSREQVLAALTALPGPPAAEAATAAPPAYHLPVAGTLVTGFGELASSGARARGMTFAVQPGTAARAPAAGIVRFARRFRSYGVVVILDHGAGWTSVVTGLAGTPLRAGTKVAADAILGEAPGGDSSTITVELYRRGRPVDIAALIG
jgi:septal ring factor EnvC (AmiA/AmiB activator)